MDDYVNLFTSLPMGNLVALILLVLLRIVPIIVMVPFYGRAPFASSYEDGARLFLTLFLVPYLVPLNMTDFSHLASL